MKTVSVKPQLKVFEFDFVQFLVGRSEEAHTQLQVQSNSQYAKNIGRYERKIQRRNHESNECE